MSYFFIKTVINNLCRAVKILNDEDLTISQFVERALVVHKLDASEIGAEDFAIKDADDMLIDDMAMITQWKNDSTFKVMIDLKVSRNKIEIVAESLRNFLKKQNNENLFDEHDIMKYLSPSSRRRLVKSIVSFIAEEYNGKATQANITTVCHAAIALFSSLKTERSTIGGIDALYDTARNTGYLLNALHYESKKKRKAAKALEQFSDDELPDESEKEEILKFFKRCVLPKDQKEVEKKMKETKAFRRSVILNDFPKYLTCWQFYFSSPELVLLDFSIMFENANESGLLDHWAKVKDIPYRQFGVRTDKAKFPVMRKDDDIYKVFMYLNLLPTAKCSFDKASHNLLIYSEDPNADAVQMRSKTLNNPYIIGIFSVVTDTTSYYIDVQDGIFALPSTFSFIQVLDMFIKMHHVFNFEYAKEFSKMMYFFEFVLYGIQASKRFLTSKMLDVATAVLNAIHSEEKD